MSWIGQILLYDSRCALRSIARRPAYAGVVIAVFALGVGVNVAVIGLAQTITSQRLPVAKPDRLVAVYESRDGRGAHPMSWANYIDYRESSDVFEELAAHYSTAPLHVTTRSLDTMLNGSVVSDNYFSMLGVEPAVGRLFAATDFRPEAPPVAVIGHRLWQRELGGGASAIGSEIEVNGAAFTIVGVAPDAFRGALVGSTSALWIPASRADVGYRFCDPFGRDCPYLNLLGRLAPGRRLADARAQLETIAARLRREYPQENGGTGVAVVPARGLRPDEAAYHSRTARTLALVSAAVLLVACANLAAFLLARNWSRAPEIAIRRALGASPTRIAALLFTESFLLALTGGAAALWIAWATATALAPYFALDSTWMVPPLSPRLLLLDFGLSTAAAGACGLVPALYLGRAARLPSRSVGHGGAVRGRSWLVVSQLAVSLALLVATVQLIASVLHLERGGAFSGRRLVTVRLRPLLSGYELGPAWRARDAVVDQLRSLPGVEAISFAAGIPGLPWGLGASVRRADVVGENAALDVHSDYVAPEYFETIGMPILRGRSFRREDDTRSEAVAVVGRSLARKLWPEGEAVGRSLVVGDDRVRVVGLVHDPYPHRSHEPPHDVLYLPFLQSERVDARLVVRIAGETQGWHELLRREIRRVDPELTVSEVETLAARWARSYRPVRLTSVVAAAAGTIGVLLAALGLYAVLAFGVARRKPEIGLRMALGASERDIVVQLLREGARLGRHGLLVGLPLAWGLSQSLAGLLYGVSASDPLAYLATAPLLAVVVLLASSGPALRAAAIEPAAALRTE